MDIKGAARILTIIGVPQNVDCSHPAPVAGNGHDEPNVGPINTPRQQYVRDGGRVGSKGVITLLSRHNNTTNQVLLWHGYSGARLATEQR